MSYIDGLYVSVQSGIELYIYIWKPHTVDTLIVYVCIHVSMYVHRTYNYSMCICILSYIYKYIYMYTYIYISYIYIYHVSTERIGIMHSTQFTGTRVPLPCLIAKG